MNNKGIFIDYQIKLFPPVVAELTLAGLFSKKSNPLWGFLDWLACIVPKLDISNSKFEVAPPLIVAKALAAGFGLLFVGSALDWRTN